MLMTVLCCAVLSPGTLTLHDLLRDSWPIDTHTHTHQSHFVIWQEGQLGLGLMLSEHASGHVASE